MFSVGGPGFLLFLAVLLPVWYRLPRQKRWLAMLAADVIFYLSLDIAGFFVLLAAAWAVWQCAERAQDSRRWFWLGLAAALGPLALKYYGPAAAACSAWFGLRLWAGEGLLIPFGLAYFTLQLISYLADVRMRRIAPEPRFARLLCYASFFLSITQGPFNRYAELMPQLDDTPAYDGARLWRGAERMAWGCFKKLAVAERAAVVTGAAFADTVRLDTSQLLFGSLMFAVQMYADFSGYTDIALGAGEMLGLELPENFRQPFFAASVQEFWSRWHMSLSRWLRDYVYIPLGGNRKGRLRQTVNVMLTFLASGLWHGAGLTYLVWGGLQGVLQIIERRMPWHKATTVGRARPLSVLYAFLSFTFTLTIFGSASLAAAWRYFACMVQNHGTRVFSNYWELGLTSRLELLLLLAGTAALAAVDVLHECGFRLRDRLAKAPLFVRGAVYMVSLFAFLFMGRFLSTGGFLYARF